MKILIFGAGNIGRSFIGQLFSRAGYHVVFVDVDQTLIDALNRAGRYLIEIKDHHPETICIENVSAVHGNDSDRVVAEVLTADIAATAVGPQALHFIYPVIAAGLLQRRASRRSPLDIIICENLRNAADAFRTGLQQHLPPGFPLSDYVGLIETSIGKMVPIMPDEVRARDPLLLYAEAYNTLILDANAFRNSIPNVSGIDPKRNMPAYVDRKAFIHNCGHAAVAYLGHLAHPDATYIWEVVANPAIQNAARASMWESAHALINRYPTEFNQANQHEHIEDLLARFANKSLGDTIYRVGRDLPRKLAREDRLVGALLLDYAENIPSPATFRAAAAGFLFCARDEHGRLYPTDARFVQRFTERGLSWALREICGLDPGLSADAHIAAGLSQAYQSLTSPTDD